MNKTAEYYLGLNYPVVVERDTDTGAYVVCVRDWPGCMSDGPSLDEAFGNLEEAKRGWVATCIERGVAIPEPQIEPEYSGRFVLRLPRSLHKQLADAAEVDGVSLNTCAVNALSQWIGNRAQSTRIDYKVPSLEGYWGQISLPESFGLGGSFVYQAHLMGCKEPQKPLRVVKPQVEAKIA